jgi:Flp pilus assembly protein TadG
MRNPCRTRGSRLHRRERRHRRERGAAAVEFALIFGFLLVPLTMGLLEYGWYFYTSQVTGSATRETARRLSVGDCTASGKAQAYARQTSGFKDLTLTFGTPAAQNNTQPPVGDVMRVTATTNGALFTFLPLPNGGQVIREVDSRVEDTTEDTAC